MRHAAAGLLLTLGVSAVAGLVGGATAALAAAVAGGLATAIEAAAVAVLRPALEPPFPVLLKRWALGLALRLTGVAAVGVAIVRWPDRAPVLPTALGFLAVLIPLLFGEMRLVVTRLRTTR
jgi:hypothetical protein